MNILKQALGAVAFIGGLVAVYGTGVGDCSGVTSRNTTGNPAICSDYVIGSGSANIFCTSGTSMTCNSSAGELQNVTQKQYLSGGGSCTGIATETNVGTKQRCECK